MNSNNRNIIIVLAGGFIVAVLVALMVQAALSGKKETPEEAPRVQVLVAAKSLSVGHDIADGDLKWQNWPEDALFPGAIIRDGEQLAIEAASGKTVRSLETGQPVHMNVLVEDNQGNFLSANVTKGMRAVGISVKSYTLADRLIRPGDYVDVLLTYRVRVNTRNNPDAQAIVNRYATETIIENVRVLAIDKEDTKAVDEVEEDGKKKKKTSSSKNATLTLEVAPTQAEQLLLATEMGDIGLALRSIGDQVQPSDGNTTTDVKMSNVLSKLSTMQQTSSGVRVYNGADMQEVEARNPAPTSGVSFDVEQAPQPNNTIYLDPALVGGPNNE